MTEYLLNKNGLPIRAGIQSLDTRAADIIDDWNTQNLHKKVFPYFEYDNQWDSIGIVQIN